MDNIRDTLERLGWPVEDLSDEQIADDLHRRWFANGTESDLNESVASLAGIISSFSSEGNLDALCWDVNSPTPEITPTNFPPYTETDESQEQPAVEKRRFKRKRAKDVVTWSIPSEETDDMTGWLVCRAAGGVAFIAESKDAPATGTTITACVHSRHGGNIDLGAATVVRHDILDDKLTLVCVELEDALWSLEQ